MKEKQSKKIFTRMLMNNWGGISHKVMEFHEYVNLFSGKVDLVSLLLWMQSRLFYMEVYLPHS